MLEELKHEEEWVYRQDGDIEEYKTRENVTIGIVVDDEDKKVAFNILDEDNRVKINTGPIEYTDIVKSEEKKGGEDAIYILDGDCSVARVFV